MNKFYRAYNDLKEKNFFCSRTECTKEESKTYEAMYLKDQVLPKDITVEDLRAGGKGLVFYRITDNDEISKEDRMEYLMLQQTESLKTIKRILYFFAVLTALGIAASVILQLTP